MGLFLIVKQFISIIPLALVRYEMIIANSAVGALLAIYSVPPYMQPALVE